MSGLTFPKAASIIEVGPRDGLQNEPQMLPTDQKIQLIKRLVAAGAREIEVTSFTHPRWIPNLADAEDVVRATAHLDFTSWALVPNRRGLERAIAAGTNGVALVMSVTDEHNQANLNRPSDESLSELLNLHAEAIEAGLQVRVSLSVVFGCPFAGIVGPEKVHRIVDRFAQAGAKRIGMCDTIGIALPDQVYDLSAALVARHPDICFELHLHDTRGMALANTVAGLQAGISSFDAAIGGLGGCPYAPGATGNCASEDLNALLTGMHIETGIDQAKLMHAASLLAAWRSSPLESAAWRVAIANETNKNTDKIA